MSNLETRIEEIEDSDAAHVADELATAANILLEKVARIAAAAILTVS
jgi:hypothetical protein